jgi:ATP-binding cassette subfamily B protein
MFKYLKSKQLYQSLFFAIIGVISGLIPYILVTSIIRKILSGETQFSSFLIYILGIGIFFALKIIFHNLSTSLSHYVAFNVQKNMREELLGKLYKMPLGDVLSIESGKLKNIIVDTIEKVEKPIAHIVPELFSNLLAFILMVAYMFSIDGSLTLISLLSVIVSVFFYILLMKIYKKYFANYKKANHKMNASIVEYVNGIETIKIFNQGNKFDTYKNTVINNNNAKKQFFDKTLAAYTAVFQIMPSTLMFVLPAVLRETISIEYIVTMVILSFGLATPIVAALKLTDSIATLSTVVGEIESILRGRELKRPNELYQLSNYNIAFKHVSFAYEKEYVLKDISFEVKEKKVVAIVGLSGSGKSTIGKLLANYWDVSMGNISIGGISMKDLSMKQLNDLISYVSQDNFLFNTTIRENLCLGSIAAEDKEIMEALKKASAYDFVSKLENGLGSNVGDYGNALSGGERQRLTIARSILKKSPIVILDEATAYMDPENEAAIKKGIDELTKEKTLIIIAHRLSTIINSDEILVVDKGRIIAKGTHKQLLKTSSHYLKMWNSYNENDLKEAVI